MEKISELSRTVIENLDGLRNSICWFILITFIWPILKWVLRSLGVYFNKIILVTVKDISNKDECRKSLCMLLSSYKFLLPLVIYGITILGFGIFLKCFLLIFVKDICVTLLVITTLLLLCSVLRIDLGKIAFNKWQVLMLLIVFNIFVFVMITTYGLNVNNVNHADKIIYLWIAILTIVNYILANYSCIKKLLLIKWRNMKWLKLIKEVCLFAILLHLLVYILQGKMQSFNFVMIMYFVIWMSLCVMEWILENYDKSVAVTVEVVLPNEVIFTREKIVQYKPSKLKVICDKGRTRVIDNKEISHIKYYLKNYNVKKKNHKVLCITYDSVCKEYQGYKYFGDNWVAFHRINEEICEVVLVPDRCIKEIIVE